MWIRADRSWLRKHMSSPQCYRLHFRNGWRPLPNVEIRLEKLSDYQDPDAGELLLGGPCVCSGYFKDPEATANLFYDEDHHWIRTGDVAKFNQDNHLMIVDRLRSIFKLSQGEYIAAELLTHVYESTDIVHQIFLYEDSTGRF
jgi:long-chain acyl-CoA synthetase